MSWFDIKELVEAYTGLERDALHIHAALFLYLAAMGVFRRNRRSRFPWLVVFAIEFANEAYDIWHNWGIDHALIFSTAALDLWNTMLWPTVLLLIGRYTSWFQRPRPGAAAAAPAERTT